jgi:hypothetical protein
LKDLEWKFGTGYNTNYHFSNTFQLSPTALINVETTKGLFLIFMREISINISDKNNGSSKDRLPRYACNDLWRFGIIKTSKYVKFGGEYFIKGRIRYKKNSHIS